MILTGITKFSIGIHMFLIGITRFLMITLIAIGAVVVELGR